MLGEPPSLKGDFPDKAAVAIVVVGVVVVTVCVGVALQGRKLTDEQGRERGRKISHLRGTGFSSCFGLAFPTFSSGLSMLSSIDLVEEGGVPFDLKVGVTSNAGLLTEGAVVGGAELILGCGRGKRTRSSECGGVVESGCGWGERGACRRVARSRHNDLLHFVLV